MPKSVVRRWLVAMWTACAALGAGGATCYVIDLSGGATTNYYPLEILDGEPVGGWTDEHKTTKLVLRRIEPGTFMMCNQIQVTLTRPFFIGVFELTQRQYELVTGLTPSFNQGDMLPVESVSWNDIRGNRNWPTQTDVAANSFMGLLRARTGLAFDLPTEAQWEYACRAGTTTDFNVPGQSLDNLGRYEDNLYDGRGGNYYYETTVGSYVANAWGLHDMHGNVVEWCLDYHSETLPGGIDPTGDTSGLRVMRGGSWNDAASVCRAAYRNAKASSSSSFDYTGFRVVCYPAEIVQSATPYDGTYDGEGHGIEVNVSSPPTAIVRYALSEAGPYQDSPILFTNATASVTVWYKVEASGYDTVTGTGTVTIAKATYDLSSVGWDYAGPFEGDGAAKTVVLTNLPVGVTATYTGNAATEPGTYTAHAVFSYDATNYEPPVMADLEWSIMAPPVLDVADIVGRPTTIGSNGVGQVEGIVDTTVDGWRSVWLTADDSSETWFETVVTNALSVSFDWKCSCEELPKKGEPYDYMMFSVDGVRLAYIGGETDWTNRTFALNGEGVQTLRWTYFKDDSDAEGEDCAWVANVAIVFPRKIFFIRIQ